MKMNHIVALALVLGMFLAIAGPASAQVLSGDYLILNRGGGNGGLIIMEADGFPTRYVDNRQGHIRFWSAGRVDMTIRGDGKVGINESNPQSVLHVTGDTRSGAFIVDNGLANGGFFEFLSQGNDTYRMTNASGTFALQNISDGQTVFSMSDTGDATFVGQATVSVLVITGGSDLSEQFDIASAGGVQVEPGSVVSIDAVNPGDLILSAKAYDRTVAGIVSGAGGLKPGMRMGQAGTIGSGKYPVALTGRVYCKADASQGAIVPGDLLTTSAVPGHAMKVVDHQAATGAIIGKAMTGLAEGEQGLVLVLVSLQ